MPTILSCRIEAEDAALLSRQAKRRQLTASALSSLYLKEKALEEEYPGIGFRDSAGGREAYLQGHRVAVWEVADVYRETKSAARTADHFRWPPALVRCALAYAKNFAGELSRQRDGVRRQFGIGPTALNICRPVYARSQADRFNVLTF